MKTKGQKRKAGEDEGNVVDEGTAGKKEGSRLKLKEKRRGNNVGRGEGKVLIKEGKEKGTH